MAGHKSRFVGADSKSGISFALDNDPKAQGSCKLRLITAEATVTDHGTRDLADLDLTATVYGS